MARKQIYLEANKGLASYEKTCLCSLFVAFCIFLFIHFYFNLCIFYIKSIVPTPTVVLLKSIVGVSAKNI